MPPSAFVRALAASAVFGAAVTGCRSAVSTHVTPDPVHGGWDKKKIRGVPVTLKVPTHMEVRVMQRRYLDPKSGLTLQEAVYVEDEIRHKDQLFFVDAVRPAAGISTSGFTAQTDQQFFASYNTTVDDQTIKTITKLVPELGEIIKNVKKAKSISETGGKIPTADDVGGIPYFDKLVAVKVFDVNLPSLTDDVRAFMDTYINNCRPACPAPVSPVSH